MCAPDKSAAWAGWAQPEVPTRVQAELSIFAGKSLNREAQRRTRCGPPPPESKERPAAREFRDASCTRSCFRTDCDGTHFCGDPRLLCSNQHRSNKALSVAIARAPENERRTLVTGVCRTWPWAWTDNVFFFFFFLSPQGGRWAAPTGRGSPWNHTNRKV